MGDMTPDMGDVMAHEKTVIYLLLNGPYKNKDLQ